MYPPLSLGLLLLASSHLSACLSSADIPRDTPVSSLISSANEHLAKGNYNDALTYFDVAISHDPRNYLTIFKRGATYLSLGKTAQASQDFDRVLSIKPDFEGALLQRAKIKKKNCDWDGAKRDYGTAGRGGGEEVAELDEAATAARAAITAAEQRDWEACVTQAGVAIMTASTCLELRKLRAKCRFEKGELHEGVGDLQHVVQIDAQGSTEPHLQMSAMLFYSLADTERGLGQIRKCLHSDPDSKICSRLFRREKAVDKRLSRVKALMEKRQFAGAVKVLIKTSEDELGLVQDIKDDIRELREDGSIHPKAPDGLVGVVVELACEAYTEMNNVKKALPFCDEALRHNPHSLAALLSRAQTLLDDEDFEGAIATLNTAKEHDASSSPKIQSLLQKAHTLLKRSKTKDYYKILGVPRDADDRDIKNAYRRLVRVHHPDKARARRSTSSSSASKQPRGDSGKAEREEEAETEKIKKEAAEKKMAAINEAYEVLSNPELRARFDRGDDPNSHENQGQPFQGQPFFFQQGGGGGQRQQFVFRNGPGGPFGGGGGGGGGFKFQFPGGGEGGFPF